MLLCGALLVPAQAALAADESVSIGVYEESCTGMEADALALITQAMSDDELDGILNDYLIVSASPDEAYTRFGACLRGIYQEVQANGFSAEQMAQLFRSAAALETGNADLTDFEPADPGTVPPTGDVTRGVGLLVNDGYVGGDETMGQAYINEAGRTMIPLRVVSEVIGYDVDWQTGGSIHISSADGSIDVNLRVGSADYTVDGVAGTFETVPTLKDDRTYLPAREFSELYGSIYWDEESHVVWIYQQDGMDYRVLGSTLLRADSDAITPLTLPDDYALTDRAIQIDQYQPITTAKVCDGTEYVRINTEGVFDDTIPLFRLDGDQLSYVCDVYGSSDFTVSGDTVYYTEGTGAGAWEPAEHPDRLYATTVQEDGVLETNVYVLDFAVNNCNLSVEDGQLTATTNVAEVEEPEVYTIDLSSLTPDYTWSRAE